MVGRMNTDLVFAEQMISGVAAEIAGKNLSQVEIAGHIADLLVSNGGFIVSVLNQARVFNYSDLLAATDPQCTTDFARTFHHTDWIDGESVVQAEQTTFEDGFNFRFNRIGDDLDHLGSDLAQAFACIAELRASVRASLLELRSEINQINKDVHECCKEDSGGGGGFTLPGDFVLPGTVGTWMGNTIIGEKEFLVYESLGRYELVPKVEFRIGDIIGGAGGGGVVNPGDVVFDRGRLAHPAELAKWFEADREVQDFIRGSGANGVTVAELNERFGDRVINADTGLTLKDTIVNVPPETRFSNPTELVDTMIELESSVVRNLRDASVVTNAFGVNDRTEIGTASVATLDLVSPEVSEALTSAGINTVDELSNLNTARLRTALRRSGITIENSDAVAVLTNARTISRLGR